MNKENIINKNVKYIER